jgi:hypothetical protein
MAACDQDDESNSNAFNSDLDSLTLEETRAAQANSEVEFILSDLDLIAFDALDNGQVSFKQAGVLLNCATVSLDTTRNPPAYIVDFGPTNCQGPDGRFRRGRQRVSFTGLYQFPGSVITVTPLNYFVNDFAVSGQRVTTNKGINANNNLNWDINSMLIYQHSTTRDTISWNSQRNREFTKGALTQTVIDNEWTITGTASANSTAGFSWPASIIQPLLYKNACAWITKGIINIQVQQLPLRVLDYGSGNCDNQAIVSIGNRSRTITLR